MSRQGTGQDGRITLADVREALREVRQALAAGKRLRLLIRDGVVHGLYLRAGVRGAQWWIEFKPPGHNRNGRRHSTRHFKLGNVQALSPDDARRLAAQDKQRVLDGQDLKAARQAAQARAVAPGWALVRNDYLAHLQRRLPNPRSRQNEVTYIEAVFELLDPRRPLRELGLADIHRLIDALPREGVLARQRLGALGRLLDWARAREITDVANPVRLLPRGARPRKPAARQRALSIGELAALWHGAETLVTLERNLLRLLIALPLRKGEASMLEWRWIDRVVGTVTLPDKIMKNGAAHSIPLGMLARQVLDQIADGTWPTTGRVFRSNNARVAEWGRFKKRIDAAVSLPAWTFHDFRRSFVSILAEHGHAEAVLDAMLAHRASGTRSGVLGVYQTSRRLPEQHKAMAAWDALLSAAIGGQVVQLRRA
jgi:integrase